MFSFLKKLFSNNPEEPPAEFEPLGRLRGSQISSTISGAKVFADTLTVSSGLNVGQTEVISASGIIASSALPMATSSSLGAIKIGTGLTIDVFGAVSSSAGTSNVVKFTSLIGDGVSNDIVVTHNLDTRDLTITVLEVETHEYVLPDIFFTTTNTMTLSFGEPPAANQYRLIIVG